MKRLFKSMMLVAVAAMGFTACSNDSIADLAPDMEQEMISMTITAEEDTRTVLVDGTTVQWAAGDVLYARETIGATVNEAISSPLAANAEVAAFTFTDAFPQATISGTTTIAYNAVYPAANVVGSKVNAAAFTALVPTTQNATATSFDGAADLLVSEQKEGNTQASELSMRFKRVVAVGKLNLVNYPGTDYIKRVVFSAEGKNLAGPCTIDLATATVTSQSADSEITVNYASGIPYTSPTIYFTCLPVDLVAGDSFTVSVTTQNAKTYTKTVTLTDEQKLSFKSGKMSTFSVDMADIAPVDNRTVYTKITSDKELTMDGTYIIVGKKKSSDLGYIFTGEASGYDTGEIVDNKISHIGPYAGEVIIGQMPDGYSLKAANGYMYGSAGANAMNFSESLTTDQKNRILFQIDGSAKITTYSDSTRPVLFNGASSSEQFLYYSETNVTTDGDFSYVWLFKKTFDGYNSSDQETTLSVGNSTMNFSGDGETKNTTVTTNYEGEISAYSTQAHFSVSVDQESKTVSVTAPHNESRTETISGSIIVSAGGKSVTISVSQEPSVASITVPATVTIPKEGGSGTLANVSWKNLNVQIVARVVDDGGWLGPKDGQSYDCNIGISGLSSTAATGSGTISYTFAENTTGADRTAVVEVYSGTELSETITVTQKGSAN